MNIFYELLEKDGLIYQKNKVIEKSLYKMFLKENRISIFGGKKKEMSQIIYLISYRNILQNIDMKKDSNVSIDLHILNKYFKDLDSMNKVYDDDKVDVFHDALNSPLVVPSKYYRKFEDTQHFTEVFNDIKKFTIKDLAKII